MQPSPDGTGTNWITALIAGIGGYLSTAIGHHGWGRLKRRRKQVSHELESQIRTHDEIKQDGRDEQRLLEVERKTEAILAKHDALVAGQESIRLEMTEMRAAMEIIKNGFTAILGALTANQKTRRNREQ